LILTNSRVHKVSLKQTIVVAYSCDDIQQYS
jgi:hypothetical protein